MPDKAHQDFDLCEIEGSIARNDMSMFPAYNVGRIGRKRMLPRTWPGKQAIDILPERAGSLFIYAATVCYLIEASLTPSKTLNGVLQQTPLERSKSPYGALDQMYTTALLQVLDKLSPADDLDGSIVLLHTPLS